MGRGFTKLSKQAFKLMHMVSRLLTLVVTLMCDERKHKKIK
jgi:hypothetical protein